MKSISIVSIFIRNMISTAKVFVCTYINFNKEIYSEKLYTPLIHNSLSAN